MQFSSHIKRRKQLLLIALTCFFSLMYLGCRDKTISTVNESVDTSSEVTSITTSDSVSSSALPLLESSQTTKNTLVSIIEPQITSNIIEETTTLMETFEISATTIETSETTVITTSVTMLQTSESTTIESSYVPDASHYISIVRRIGNSVGLDVFNETDWESYSNPILLDSNLSDSSFESYVSGIVNELVLRGNGNRFSICVWISDERTSGNQTQGPGFYLYIG